MFNTLMKKTLLIVMIALICLNCISAKGSYSPSVQGYIEGSFIFPTADYLKTAQGRKLPAMRTSLNFAADVMAANFSINNLEIGAGYAITHNTRSLAAGNHIIRAYTGMGVVVGAQYHFENKFSLGSKLRYMFCSYYPFKNRFDTLELEVTPSFDVVRNKKFETSIMLPVDIVYKTDYVNVRVGVGFDVQYNLIFGAKREKN